MPENALGFLMRAGTGSAIVQATSGFLAFILSITLARMLGPEAYGAYAFAFALIILLSVPIHSGMGALIVRETSRELARGNYHNLKELWGWGLRTVFIFSCVAIAVISLFVFILHAHVGAGRIETILIGLLLLPIMAFATVLGSSLRGLGHVLLGQLGLPIVRPLLFLGVFLSWSFLVDQRLAPWQTMGAHLAGAFGALVFSCWLFREKCPNLPAQTNPSRRERHLRRAALLPLTLLTGLQVVNAQLDVLILGLFRPDADVGVYQAIINLVMLVAFAMTALSAVLQPHIASLYLRKEKDKLQKLVTLSTWIMFVGASIPAALFVFSGTTILDFLFGIEFARGARALSILALGKFGYAALGMGVVLLTMAGHEEPALKVTIGAVLLNIFLNVTLVPFFNIEGAAFATAMTYLIWNVALRITVRRMMSIESSIISFTAQDKTRRHSWASSRLNFQRTQSESVLRSALVYLRGSVYTGVRRPPRCVPCSVEMIAQ